MSESSVSRRFPWLAYGLFALAGGLVANLLLGPLVSETIRYHYMTTGHDRNRQHARIKRQR